MIVVRNRILRVEAVAQRHVDRLGPQVTAGRGVHEVSGHTNRVVRAPDAAASAMPALVSRVRFVCLDGDHAKTLEPRQPVDELLRHAGAEVLEVSVLAVIGKRRTTATMFSLGERGRQRRLVPRSRPSRRLNTGAYPPFGSSMISSSLLSFVAVVARDAAREAGAPARARSDRCAGRTTAPSRTPARRRHIP